MICVLYMGGTTLIDGLSKAQISSLCNINVLIRLVKLLGSELNNEPYVTVQLLERLLKKNGTRHDALVVDFSSFIAQFAEYIQGANTFHGSYSADLVSSIDSFATFMLCCLHHEPEIAMSSERRILCDTMFGLVCSYAV